MPCLVPFNGNDLDITMFAWRPTGVFPEELIEALKYFSYYAEDLGCLFSSVMRSIHGSMVIWYGAWAKRSNESRKALHVTLGSAVKVLSSFAVLLDYGFFLAEVGESKDGRRTARFSTGDTLSFIAMVPKTGDHTEDLSYACLAFLKSGLSGTQGIAAGVQFRCVEKPMVAVLYVWESLAACYAWLLTCGYRASAMPYVSHLSNDAEYDVFKVVYVSTEEVVNVRFLRTLRSIEHAGDAAAGPPFGAGARPEEAEAT